MRLLILAVAAAIVACSTQPPPRALSTAEYLAWCGRDALGLEYPGGLSHGEAVETWEAAITAARGIEPPDELLGYHAALIHNLRAFLGFLRIPPAEEWIIPAFDVLANTQPYDERGPGIEVGPVRAELRFVSPVEPMGEDLSVDLRTRLLAAGCYGVGYPRGE